MYILIDTEIFFESLHLLEDDSYVKRTHFSLKCSTTPKEIQKFFKKTHQLFSWKKTLIDHVEKLIDHE